MRDSSDKERLSQQFIITNITGWTFVATFLWLIRNGVVHTQSVSLSYILLAGLLLVNLLLHHVLPRRLEISTLFAIESFVYLLFAGSFIHLTGGLRSVFWFLYFVPVMISLFVLELRYCFLIFAGAVLFTLLEMIAAYFDHREAEISIAFMQIFGLALLTSLGYFLNRWVVYEKEEKDKALNNYDRELRLSKGLILLANAILERKGFEDVLHTILRLACVQLDMNEAGMWIKSQIKEEKEFIVCVGLRDEDFKNQCRFIRHRITHGQFREEILQDENGQKISQLSFDETEGIPFTTVIRISSGDLKCGGWVGIMFYVQTSRVLVDFEKHFFSAIGRMISLALENQKVIIDLNKALEERSKKIADLLVLYEVTKRMTSRLDLESTIHEIVAMAVGSMNVSTCIIFLVGEGNKAFVAGKKGISSEEIDEKQLNNSEGVCAKIIETKRTMSTDDFDPSILGEWLRVISSQQELKNVLAVPIIFQDNVRGVLAIFSGDQHNYLSAEKQLLETLADHAAIAIKNATTYELLQTKTQELEQSQDRLEKINQELLHQQSQLLETAEELEDANKELKKADEVKNDFVATVSHELRTPLTSIKESVAIVLDGMMGELNEDQKKFLGITKNNVERLSLIINDLLDFSKLEFGTLGVEKQKVDLREIVKSSKESFEPAMIDKKIEFSMDLKETSLWIYADPGRMTQTLYNLLSNAQKYTPSKGKIRITVKSVHREYMLEQLGKGVFDKNAMEQVDVEDLLLWKDLAMVSVTDTGSEIPEEDKKKIFEKFTQARLSNSSQEGTGLGLAIVKKIMQMHQGVVWVSSEGQGWKSFNLCLPLYSEALRHSNIVNDVYLVASKCSHRVMLLNFEFAGDEDGYELVVQKLNDLDRLNTIIDMMQCQKKKCVYRIGLKKILVVIYDGDQTIATTFFNQVRDTIENSELKEWVGKMHFSVSDVSIGSSFQTRLIDKLSEIGIT